MTTRSPSCPQSAPIPDMALCRANLDLEAIVTSRAEGRISQHPAYHGQEATEMGAGTRFVGYDDFIASKHVRQGYSGFDASPSGMLPALHDWQKEIAAWACRKGRAALFCECGLGKTPMQLSWAHAVVEHSGRDVLIVAPLAVNNQTVREGHKFGVEVHQCRTQDDARPGVNITNYEMLRHFDPTRFAGVVLDESGILKSFMGKTKRQLVEFVQAVPYRLPCTATPAPNDLLELGNHADFLGVMKSSEMLTRWFINDGGQAGAYRLKSYAERDFWQWVASWAVCIQSPADLGYPDDRYILPPLQTVQHVVRTDESAFDRGLLVETGTLNVKTLHAELRRSAPVRAARAAEIVNDINEPAVVWCFTDYEAEELMAHIPDAIEVRGSMPVETKVARLEAFTAGNARVLVTKPRIAGWGLNWQHCRTMVTVGPSYSFEARYQSVRRCWRYGQDLPVFDHVVMTRREAAIFNAAVAKEERHNSMADAMRRAGHELSNASRRELSGYAPSQEIKIPAFLRGRAA